VTSFVSDKITGPKSSTATILDVLLEDPLDHHQYTSEEFKELQKKKEKKNAIRAGKVVRMKRSLCAKCVSTRFATEIG
jgi:hypothetical protein